MGQQLCQAAVTAAVIAIPATAATTDAQSMHRA